MKNTSVSLGPHFEGYIADRIASGRFNSASEVIRDALRAHEIEEKKRYDEWAKWANAELEKGEASGIAEDFDPKKFLEGMHAEWIER
jgi:antitoxin ParD1/3/4